MKFMCSVITFSVAAFTSISAQELSAIAHSHHVLTQGQDPTRLNVTGPDLEAVRHAQTLRINITSTRPSSLTWQFGAAFDPTLEAISLTAPLAAPLGEYALALIAEDANGTISRTEFTATVTAPQFIPHNIPVVLLNGFQAGNLINTCPQGRADGTFGSLPALLASAGTNWVFFDNCNECPNCSIEQLGSVLANYLSRATYTDGTPVPVFDVIAHSMGGLIVRSYLSGKQTPIGVFSPPSSVLIRKATFIATPHFGSFLAPTLPFSTQANEMSPGSQFLYDLARWNQAGDDLRGIDALAIIGDGNSGGPDDGVVALTSASLRFATSSAHTRVLPYCHIDNIATCSGTGIANVTSASHPTWRIISSFLNGTDDWKTIGNDTTQDFYLSQYVGVSFSFQDNNGISTSLSKVSLYNWNEGLSQGPTNTMFYRNFADPGQTEVDYQFTNGNVSQSSTFDLTSWIGGWVALLVKDGPVIQGISSGAYAGRGWTVASGADVTITGVNLTDNSNQTHVLANNTLLVLSQFSSGSLTARLPAGLNGLVSLSVRNGYGSDTRNIIVAPPQPGIFSVINAASLTGGSVAPGELITIFGTGIGPNSGVVAQSALGAFPTNVAGVQVTVGGKLCPLLYVSKSQINAMVPFEVPIGSAAVVVNNQGVATQAIWLGVSDAAPGIFPGAILNQDYSLNRASARAAAVSVVQIYATGGGQTDSACKTGAAATACLLAEPASATVGGVAAQVLYAGTAPGLISGLVQVNVRIPSSMSTGTFPITLSIDGHPTQTGIVVNVQ